MYALIEGTVFEKSAGEAVLMAGGVGYLLSCSAQTLTRLPAIGETARLYTYLLVREDALELFGFESREEKRMFLRLISVSGIGPRTALGVLGSMPLRDLTLAIVTGDAVSLSRAPGIGKKTAQRIALELREKVEQQELEATGFTDIQAASGSSEPAAEAVAALRALGYTAAEAARAISLVKDQAADTGELVRLALRGMQSP